MKRLIALLLLCGLAWGQGYVIQHGDTPQRIARLFQVSLGDLKLANGFVEGPLIAGQQLVIPGSDWDPMNLEVLPLPALVEETPQWIFISPPAAPKEPKPVPPSVGVTQQGLASWYGPRFHGRRTANGERFNQFDLTAAQRTLPFNTRVRVTNLQNGQSIVVRINDRAWWFASTTVRGGSHQRPWPLHPRPHYRPVVRSGTSVWNAPARGC